MILVGEATMRSSNTEAIVIITTDLKVYTENFNISSSAHYVRMWISLEEKNTK